MRKIVNSLCFLACIYLFFYVVAKTDSKFVNIEFLILPHNKKKCIQNLFLYSKKKKKNLILLFFKKIVNNYYTICRIFKIHRIR